MKGFPGSSIGRESACQCRSHKRHGFNPWVRKVPWRRAWQPTPVFSPGEPWTEEPGGLQPTGLRRELGVTEGTERAHVVLSPLGGASGAPGNAGPLCVGAGRVQWEAKWWVRSDSLEQDAWKGCGQARGCQAGKGKVRRRERPPSSSFSAVSSAPPPGLAGRLLVPTWSSQDCHGTMEKLFQASVQWGPFIWKCPLSINYCCLCIQRARPRDH